MNAVIARWMNETRESLSGIEDALRNGAAKNYEEYRELVGKRHGFLTSLRAMENFIQEADKKE